MAQREPFATALFHASPQPTDLESRAETYPPVAHATFKGMGEAFNGMFNDPNTPTDPAMVVDEINGLIDTPAGSRPFRTVVGVDVGVRERNAAVEPFDAAVLAAFGMTEFATLARGRPT